MAKRADWLTFGLETAANSPRRTEWMYEQLRQYVRGDVLEVGSGVGTISEKLAADTRGRVLLTDVEPTYLTFLRRKFRRSNRVLVRRLDLSSTRDFRAIRQRFDTILCINVLEHVNNDVQALLEMRKLLKPRGALVLLVPAHPRLYNHIDSAIGHFRRYARSDLCSKLRNSGFEIYRIYYHNMFGIPGWYLNGSILKKHFVNSTAAGWFDRAVPIFRSAEELVGAPTGVNLIAVCYSPRSKRENLTRICSNPS